MNNNHRITLNTNKNIIVEFTNERIIPASGLAVVGALLGKSDLPWNALHTTISITFGFCLR